MSNLGMMLMEIRTARPENVDFRVLDVIAKVRDVEELLMAMVKRACTTNDGDLSHEGVDVYRDAISHLEEIGWLEETGPGRWQVVRYSKS